MRIQCVCGQKYQIKDAYRGQYVRCRKCGHELLVHDGKAPLPTAPLPTAPNTPLSQSANPQTAGQPSPGHPSPAQPSPHHPSPSSAMPGWPVSPDPSDPLAADMAIDLGMDQGFENAQEPPPVYTNQAAPDTPIQSLPPTRFPAKRGPRKPIRLKTKSDYRHVNTGLNLVFAGMLLSTLCQFPLIPRLVIPSTVIPGLLVLLGALGTVLLLIGLIFSSFAPAPIDGRLVVVAACICATLKVGIQVRGIVLYSPFSFDHFLRYHAGSMAAIPDPIAWLFSSAAVALLLIYMLIICNHAGDKAGASSARWLLSCFISACVFTLILATRLSFTSVENELFQLMYGLVRVLAVTVVMCIWLGHFFQFTLDLNLTANKKSKSSK